MNVMRKQSHPCIVYSYRVSSLPVVEASVWLKAPLEEGPVAGQAQRPMLLRSCSVCLGESRLAAGGHRAGTERQDD